MNNTYWFFKLKKNKAKPKYKGKELPDQCILEFMYDGIVYLWPVMQDYTNLCNQCVHYPEILKSVPEAAQALCNGILPCKECRFKQVINMPIEEDLEGLMMDGDYIFVDGSYHSIFDFITNSRYSMDSYDFTNLGYFDSIRSCRSECVQFH